MSSKLSLIGHRGACTLEPENTLRSIARAIECAADMVEVDVRACGDGELVIIHDETLDRTTNGSGRVRDLTLEELRRLDAGRGEKIPTLREALELMKDARVRPVIEIKEEGIEERILEEVSRADLAKSAFFVSFSPRSVKRVEELFPAGERGIIFARPIPNPVQLALELGAQLLPRWDLVTTKLLNSAREKGVKVFAWVLNSEADFRRAIDMGLDGFATDNPCFARRIIG
jgi:glycerophosphoryl diester phosphodiesterase